MPVDCYYRIFPITIALVFLIHHHVGSTTTCDTPRCIQEASRIVDYIDPSTNPCEDFYQFACGTFLKQAHGNEKLLVWTQMEERLKNKKIEIHAEDIKDEDHKMVKAVKNFYRACMNEEEIKPDFIKTIKKTLKIIGGWPVVEGLNWKEENFDWVNATYELRRMGYHFSAFINVGLQKDPFTRRNILQVFLERRHNSFREDVRNLAKLAVLLGAEDEESVAKELLEAYNAFEELHSDFSNPGYGKQTIEGVQKSDGIINWLEFIKNIVGLKINISNTDEIMFPKNQQITKRIEALKKIPKRAQANYMMWEVIKSIFYLVEDAELFPYKSPTRGKDDSRADYCLRITRRSFTMSVPYPLDIIRLRRDLPKEKKGEIEEIISNIKSVSLEILNQTAYLPENIKRTYMYRMGKNKIIVGLSRDYFDDKILEEADLDMMEIEDETSFFSLLAQATRNKQTEEYSKLLQGVDSSGLPNADSVYLPPVLYESPVFEESRPKYLNYGNFGGVISKFLWQLIRFQIDANVEIKNCPFLNTSELNEEDKKKTVRRALETSIYQHISYSAYQEWRKKNGEELKLIATKYTPNQLFWISFVNLVCKPLGTADLTNLRRRDVKHQMISDLVSDSLRLNPNFARDFNCPVNSRLNPSTKCNVL